ncbi:hypothetical protein D3C75_454190 [compost metagenome]
MVAVEGRVQITHHLTHFFAFTADDDTVGASAVGHGRTFFQEFRIGDDIELQYAPDADQAFVDVCTQGIAGADRDGGFLHQDRRLLAMTGHGVAHRHHVAQVRRAVVPGRGANGDEQHLSVLDGEFFVAGELQSPGVKAFAYQAGQPGFEYTHVALLEQFDFIFVNVHADHVVADFRQYRCLHQADISATKYTDFHGSLLDSGARAGRDIDGYDAEDEQCHAKAFPDGSADRRPAAIAGSWCRLRNNQNRVRIGKVIFQFVYRVEKSHIRLLQPSGQCRRCPVLQRAQGLTLGQPWGCKRK